MCVSCSARGELQRKHSRKTLKFLHGHFFLINIVKNFFETSFEQCITFIVLLYVNYIISIQHCNKSYQPCVIFIRFILILVIQLRYNFTFNFSCESIEKSIELQDSNLSKFTVTALLS